MASEVKELNCCASPALAPLRTLIDTSHDTESVSRCGTCGAHWLSAWHEYLTFGPDGDLSWTWYARLSENESAALLLTSGVPDHQFLRGRLVVLVHHSDKGRVELLDGPPRWVL